ncbi:hypothetical protein B566_EDAN010720 [Ephemera danica]|nr:hypothetical protein B566_EDAN010720 [Ephemera danica]
MWLILLSLLVSAISALDGATDHPNFNETTQDFTRDHTRASESMAKNVSDQDDHSTLSTTEPPYDCNAILIERIRTTCCKVPVLIPEEVKEKCLTRNVSLAVRRRYPGYKRGPLCLHDCRFRELKFLHHNEEESLNLLAITSSFANAVSAPWKLLVREAIITCNEQLSSQVSASVLQTAVGDNCTVSPLLFIKCVKKILIQKCPASEKYPNITGEECTKDLERLEGCNPFFLTPQQNMSLARLRRPDDEKSTTRHDLEQTKEMQPNVHHVQVETENTQKHDDSIEKHSKIPNQIQQKDESLSPNFQQQQHEKQTHSKWNPPPVKNKAVTAETDNNKRFAELRQTTPFDEWRDEFKELEGAAEETTPWILLKYVFKPKVPNKFVRN